MRDARFCQLLGVAPDATAEQIRRAWRRRVMDNHPDRFPAAAKDLQELKIIALNEAYASLMAPRAAEIDGGRSPPGAPEGGPVPQPAAAPSTAVGPHRDPAYAWYKQGFRRFSLAVHGIAELDGSLAGGPGGKRPRRYAAAQEFAASLRQLGEAHGYFTRVVERYPDSVWSADARFKMKRIEQFTSLYRRILANLGGMGARVAGSAEAEPELFEPADSG